MSAIQSTVRRSVARAFVGQLSNTGDPKNRVKSAANRVPLRAQVGTITVDTAADATAYTWTINGIELSLVSATSETTTTIAVKIAAAINANPAVRGQVRATSATNVVTLTGVFPGVAFTASDADANLTTVEATVAPLSAAALRPGRWAVLLGPLAATSPDVSTGLDSVAPAAAANLTAQQSSWVYTTYEAGVILEASVTIDGQTYAVSHTSATDGNTSAAALRAKLTAALDGKPITVSGATNVITLTATTAGVEFIADIFFGSTATTAVLTTTSRTLPVPGTGISFGGIVERHLSDEDDASGLVFPGGSTVPVVVSGKVWAVLSGGAAPTAGAPVWVYVGATAADQGKIYSATGTDRIQVPNAFASFTGRTDTSGGVTLVEIDVTAR
jgi:hypothetical protein